MTQTRPTSRKVFSCKHNIEQRQPFERQPNYQKHKFGWKVLSSVPNISVCLSQFNSEYDRNFEHKSEINSDINSEIIGSQVNVFVNDFCTCGCMVLSSVHDILFV